MQPLQWIEHKGGILATTTNDAMNNPNPNKTMAWTKVTTYERATKCN